ncbi:MAG: hypothetical protein WCE25_08915, partial [Nitrososphaeraceae archaeon]
MLDYGRAGCNQTNKPVILCYQATGDCGCEPSAQRPVVTSGAVPSLQTSCCSSVVTPGDGATVALNGCGCEPSEQRPLELGGIPSVHNGCSPGAPVGGAVTLAVAGGKPSAQRPVEESG